VTTTYRWFITDQIWLAVLIGIPATLGFGRALWKRSSWLRRGTP
jgi:hypothetical protein